MDLNLLPIFLAIYDCGSVSRAAERLQVSQSGLSTALKRLRVALDDPLFIPTGRGLKPTPRAHSLAAPVRSIMGAVDRDILRDEAYEASDEIGEFRIALTDAGESSFLPRIVPSLVALAPRASFRSITFARSDVARALEDGLVDVAFGDFSGLQSGTLMQQTIGPYSFLCLIRSDHPFTGRKLSLQQLADWKQAAVDTDKSSQHLLDAYFKKHRIERKVLVRNAHYQTLPRLLAKSDLMAIVPDRVASYLEGPGLVKTVLPPTPMPTSHVAIMWHRRLQNDPRNKWIRTACVQAIRRSAVEAKLKTRR